MGPQHHPGAGAQRTGPELVAVHDLIVISVNSIMERTTVMVVAISAVAIVSTPILRATPSDSGLPLGGDARLLLLLKEISIYRY